MTARQEHRQRMLDAVAKLFVDRPFEQLSFNGIAEASGVSLWALRYNFDNPDRLFRAVAHRLIESVESAIDAESERSTRFAAVLDAIAGYADFTAELVRRPEYRDLLYLVIRNGRHHDWLRHAYERRIVGKICDKLERLVRETSEQHGLTVLLRANAAQRFHKRIETELALSVLLPSSVDDEQLDVARLLRDVVHETFAATYAFEWGSASAA